jgi:hypothetical protein
MAANVQVTPGTGDVVAADDVSSVKYQKVKLVDGTAGQTTAITAGGGVEAGALRVTVANDSTGVLSIDDNGGAITVDGTVAVTNAGITSIDGKVTACNTGAVVLAAGTAEIGKLAAGTALVGKVGIDQVTANANEVVTKTGSITTATLNAETTKVIGVTRSADGSGNLLTSTGQALDINIKTGNPTTITATQGTPSNLKSEVTNAGTFAVQSEIQQKTGYGQGKVDNADTTTARAITGAEAQASKYFYIKSILISVAVAGSYWIEDADAAQITCKFTLAANGGVSWNSSDGTPLKSTTVNKGLYIKGSSAGVVGCMITFFAAT